MKLDIKDRVPTLPNRVLITPEDNGIPYYATLTRADEPTQEGTPINKQLLDDMTTAGNIQVSDEVGSLFGLNGDIKDVDNALQKIVTVTPQYTTLLNISVPLLERGVVYSFDLLHPTADFDELIFMNSLHSNKNSDGESTVYVSFYDNSFNTDTYVSQVLDSLSGNEPIYSNEIASLKKTIGINYRTITQHSLNVHTSNDIVASYVFNSVGKIFIRSNTYEIRSNGRIRIIGVKYNEN